MSFNSLENLFSIASISNEMHNEYSVENKQAMAEILDSWRLHTDSPILPLIKILANSKPAQSFTDVIYQDDVNSDKINALWFYTPSAISSAHISKIPLFTNEIQTDTAAGAVSFTTFRLPSLLSRKQYQWFQRYRPISGTEENVTLLNQEYRLMREEGLIGDSSHSYITNESLAYGFHLGDFKWWADSTPVFSEYAEGPTRVTAATLSLLALLAKKDSHPVLKANLSVIKRLEYLRLQACLSFAVNTYQSHYSNTGSNHQINSVTSDNFAYSQLLGADACFALVDVPIAKAARFTSIMAALGYMPSPCIHDKLLTLFHPYLVEESLESLIQTQLSTKLLLNSQQKLADKSLEVVQDILKFTHY